MSRTLANWLLAPAVVLLFVWMIVPLSMTIYFSFVDYSLYDAAAERGAFVGFRNFRNFMDAEFWYVVRNTFLLVSGILLITLVFGVLIALLVNRAFPGRGFVRVLLISPFFIMPAVNAMLWKNLMLHPANGLIAFLSQLMGVEAVEMFSPTNSLLGVILIVSWQWVPFAVLIFMTSLQSEDQEQKEAAVLDGASALSQFWNLTLPHLARPIAIVMMIQLIFHLGIFAEILLTSGGAGNETLAFKIHTTGSGAALDIGRASAGGIFAVILANIAAIFLIRLVGKSIRTT